ncbi:hypothetical protein NMG60_11008259 [Bertholletia excelsa]
MEGLIPLVCRRIKKNRVRRQYKCLSSLSAQSYDIADFYPDGFLPEKSVSIHTSATEGAGAESCGGGHRRHSSSLPDYYSNCGKINTEIGRANSKRLMRFGSHRLLGCVTGAA